MKKSILLPLFLMAFLMSFSQRPSGQRPSPITISGTVYDKDTNQPLEYATLILQSVRRPEMVTGGISDLDGKFSVQTMPGQYNVRVEYLSYKTFELKAQTFRSSTDLGAIQLEVDAEMLEDVVVVGERTTVELRLDKKVYNVGQDLTVRGGSVTDVLDNVPSVTVDVEGNISLRGNESVRILINGKPSALSGLSPQALQQLPAESIERVEVITNPSARYDAEGTAGILNIILRQSKTAGVNGSVNVFAGYPDNYGTAVSLNLRREKFNIFTTTTYRYRDAPGNALFEQENFDENGNTVSFQDEIREYQRQDNSFNTNIGFEYFFSETSSITNSLVIRKSDGENTVDIDFFNFDEVRNPTIRRNRSTVEAEEDDNVQYSVNYKKTFDKEGHEFTMDYQYSRGDEIENSIIDEIVLGESAALPTEQTINDESQINQLVQFDYVLPFGKDNMSQFEMGYRGTFNNFNTDFDFGILEDGVLDRDPDFSNELNYKEYVNAAYMQLGTKVKKFSVLGGLRMEASDIGIELVDTQEVSDKDYVNWFPSLFLGYEFSETEQLTISYSRRLRRPRSRFINPFPSRSSNTNLFQGNPDLDPTFTNAFDLGYLKRWDKITFTTSGYFNRSTGVFQFITQETGDFVEIENPDDPNNPVLVPVQARTPINLATDSRYGMEFTTTYTPKRDWRLTLNLNLFQQQLRGDYTYTNFLNEEITQNFDADNFTWFTRFSAKIPMPGDIDFQSNIFYRGPRKDAQNENKGILSTNLAFSKDVIKDKATLSLNVSDVFNSRKRRTETITNTVATYSEFQWRERQITLSFLYRFNQPQNQRNRNGRGGQEEEFEFEGT
ncbi:MAG: TonB-dependent receptor [Flavobacteriaceae bacterium]|nr:TonB-dependent receptor [Muriicola sp.]NNC62909.1 TonB-dependent receptor [Eudoraea sp.]NNK20229.1 TonB-dependent receptor [Flavobacteriaceae bacterium]MBT8290156.1 TonB-dependent receptor [Muriicola sp.]NNK35350.1 TonB-dependent receptor [Eudoraea sp.]